MFTDAKNKLSIGAQTERVIHTLCGLIPAAATYISSLPIGIPIPWTPRSPKPRIRLPSVRTIMSTCHTKKNRKQYQKQGLTRGQSTHIGFPFYLMSWPIVDHRHHLPFVLRTKIHTTWTSKQPWIILAHQSNCWSVYYWSKIFNVINKDLGRKQ